MHFDFPRLQRANRFKNFERNAKADEILFPPYKVNIN